MRWWLLLLVIAGGHSQEYVYHKSICTGLGDRLGIVAMLGAVARAYNVNITFCWCNDPMTVVKQNPHHLQYIPRWVGYQYPLSDPHFFEIPRGVNILLGVDHCQKAGSSYVVTDEADTPRTPPMDGLPSLPTLGHIMWGVSNRAAVSPDVFRRAYQEAASELRPRGVIQKHLDVVLHVRAPDRNTYKRNEHVQRSYCTREAVHAVLEANHSVVVVTNRPKYTQRHVLGTYLSGLVAIQSHDSDWEDLELLFGARAILQHASTGWSAFSSVAALARGIPLLNTYRDHYYEHRVDLFARYGEVPQELQMRCSDIASFVQLIDIVASSQHA